MELAVLFLLFAGFLLFFKLLAVLLKGTLYIVSVPFQIAGAILGVALLIILIPLALIAGALAVVFAPLFILGPLLPLGLVVLGLYLVFKD